MDINLARTFLMVAEIGQLHRSRRAFEHHAINRFCAH